MQHNNQHRKKVLLCRFRFNLHSLVFHPQTQYYLEPPLQVQIQIFLLGDISLKWTLIYCLIHYPEDNKRKPNTFNEKNQIYLIRSVLIIGKDNLFIELSCRLLSYYSFYRLKFESQTLIYTPCLFKSLFFKKEIAS